MGLKKVFKTAGKVFGAAAPFISPVGGVAVSLIQARNAGRKAKQEYNAQQASIAEASRRADSERQKIASERTAAEEKLKRGQIRSNRRRVKGGLFGDSNIDNNTSPRLGG